MLHLQDLCCLDRAHIRNILFLQNWGIHQDLILKSAFQTWKRNRKNRMQLWVSSRAVPNPQCTPWLGASPYNRRSSRGTLGSAAGADRQCLWGGDTSEKVWITQSESWANRLLDSSKSLSNNERHVDGYNSFLCWHINLSVIQCRTESITLICFHRQIEKSWF